MQSNLECNMKSWLLKWRNFEWSQHRTCVWKEQRDNLRIALNLNCPWFCWSFWSRLRWIFEWRWISQYFLSHQRENSTISWGISINSWILDVQRIDERSKESWNRHRCLLIRTSNKHPKKVAEGIYWDREWKAVRIQWKKTSIDRWVWGRFVEENGRIEKSDWGKIWSFELAVGKSCWSS